MTTTCMPCTIYISVAADYACDSLSDMCRLVDRSTDLDPNVLKIHAPCILLNTSYGIIHTSYSSRQNKEAIGLKCVYVYVCVHMFFTVRSYH